jgi:hypothetical protein
MGQFVARLSETSASWARAVAPIAEWVAGALSSNISKPNRQIGPATRLTQSHKRLSRGAVLRPNSISAPPPDSVCQGCGKPIARGRKNCVTCAVPVSRENLRDVARIGRLAALSPKAQNRRAESQRRHEAAKREWSPSDQPAWLNREAYTQRIQPRLRGLTNNAIASALGVSDSYAANIRSGKRVPHPRHWQILAQLSGFHQ